MSLVTSNIRPHFFLGGGVFVQRTKQAQIVQTQSYTCLCESGKEAEPPLFSEQHFNIEETVKVSDVDET